MIFGNSRRSLLRLPVVAALFYLLLSAEPASPQNAAELSSGWGIAQLMLSLKQVKAASGQFVERKTLLMMKEPLVASGTLLYVAPDQLQKITVLPKRQRLALDRDILTIEGGPEDGSRSLSLSEHPEVAAFVEGVRSTLAGDLAALARFYDIELEGAAGDWQLSLRPKDPKLRELVKRILIAGSDKSIRRVDTEETDGDHSEMSIVEVVQ